MSDIVIATNANTKLAQYLNKKFLTTAQDNICLAKYATPSELPSQAGSLTMRMFKRRKGDASRVQTVTTEGQAITFANTVIDYVDVALVQYADASRISARLQKVEIFNNVDKETAAQGEAASAYFDNQLRNAIIDPASGSSKRIYAQGAASFAALNTAGYTTGKLTCKDIKRLVTSLKNSPTNPAKPLKLTSDDGKLSWSGFIVLVSEDQSSDLQDDPDWKLLCQHSHPELMQKGEIGQWAGAKILTTNLPFQEDGAGMENTYVGTVTSGHNVIHTAIAFGDEGFGASDLATGGNWMSPSVQVLDKADKSDVINQWIILAWTAYFGCKVLDRQWVAICKSVIGTAP